MSARVMAFKGECSFCHGLVGLMSDNMNLSGLGKGYRNTQQKVTRHSFTPSNGIPGGQPKQTCPGSNRPATRVKNMRTDEWLPNTGGLRGTYSGTNGIVRASEGASEGSGYDGGQLAE